MAAAASFLILTDSNGLAVAINPNLVQGLTVAAGVTPAAVRVQTATEAFVVPGTVAGIAAQLAAAASAGTIIATIKSSDGSILGQNAAAIAAGLAVTHNGVGDNTVTLTTPPSGSPGTEIGVSLTALDKESVTLGAAVAASYPVLGWDAAGAASDINFMIQITPTA